MTVRDQLRAQRDEILLVAKAHGAQHVRLVRSVARGEDSAASDIDLLVTLGPGRTLLDLAPAR